MITITDGTRTLEIGDKDIEIAETDCLDFYEWTCNAALEKCRRVTDRIVLGNTNLNPDKLTVSEKADAIKDVVLKSVRNKNAELLIKDG